MFIIGSVVTWSYKQWADKISLNFEITIRMMPIILSVGIKDLMKFFVIRHYLMIL